MKVTGLDEYESIIKQERLKNGPYINASTSIQRLQNKIPNIKEKLQNIKSLMVRTAMQNASSSKSNNEGLRKFYERAPKYAAFIGGYWPLRFTNEQEDRIRKLYIVAYPAYDKFRKPSQPNWPGGYAYFLRCLCILLGWDEFCGHFNISCGPKNVEEREIIRKKIWTNELDWEFVPSSPPSKNFKLLGDEELLLFNNNNNNKLIEVPEIENNDEIMSVEKIPILKLSKETNLKTISLSKKRQRE